MAARLMVSPYKHRQVRCPLLSRIVLVEIPQCTVLWRAGHDIQILHIPDSLEVTANDKKVYTGPFVDLAGLCDRVVDSIESAMALMELVEVFIRLW